MQELIVNGGRRLYGEAEIKGAKNAALPIMAACLLTKEECIIRHMPMLDDVFSMSELLRSYGVRLGFEGSVLSISSPDIRTGRSGVDESIFRSIRASALLMAPLLHRLNHISIPLPGGCAIGARPLDYHLRAFEQMGVEVLDCGDHLLLRCNCPIGTDICLDFPSVGATENIMMLASLAYGRTVIRNAACEPEIPELAAFLNKMGARIHGAGSNVMEIEGVNSLHSAEHWVMPDRIELGTMMIAAAMAGGDCLLRNADSSYCAALIAKLREIGIGIYEDSAGIRVIAKGRPHAADIITMPYPGFPTDMQPQYMALMSMAKGNCLITESIFESRFKHVTEMRRMGADIKITGRSAIVSGRSDLHGASVTATDLRAGAALVLMGLTAEGESRIGNIGYIDRGYQAIEKTLSGLGADICRIYEE